MNLEGWLRDRLTWVLAPGVFGNLAAVAVAGPWAVASASLRGASLQSFVLLGVGLTFALELAHVGLAAGRLTAFRALVSGRLQTSPVHRLAAIGELRRLPGRLALQSLLGWLLCAALLGLGMVVLDDAPWSTAARLATICVLFAPLAAALVSLLTAAPAFEACDRLSEGLSPRQVIDAAPAQGVSVRTRTVGFTALLTVVPVLMLADVALVGLRGAAGELVQLAPAARQAGGDALFGALAFRLAGLGALSLAFAVLAASAAGRSLARPLRQLAQHAQRVADGHLDAPRVIAGDAEVWRVTQVFALLHQRLAALVAQVVQAGGDVSRATDSLQRTSIRSQATASDQAASLNETSATTEELARSARQIAASAASVLELSGRTLDAAEQGRRDATAFAASVERMKQDNRSIAGAVDRLRRRVQQIGRIVELINAVADRSDLLALSAELEGTRAGDVGRGFSLVGAEMRRLAENVLESTAEVEELISEIRDATVSTARATERGSILTARGTALADEVTASLASLGQLALETANQVRGISLATQQQQSGTDQLAEAMSDIFQGTQAEARSTRGLGEINQRLLSLATSLQAVVSRFAAGVSAKPGSGDERRRGSP